MDESDDYDQGLKPEKRDALERTYYVTRMCF